MTTPALAAFRTWAVATTVQVVPVLYLTATPGRSLGADLAFATFAALPIAGTLAIFAWARVHWRQIRQQQAIDAEIARATEEAYRLAHVSALEATTRLAKLQADMLESETTTENDMQATFAAGAREQGCFPRLAVDNTKESKQ